MKDREALLKISKALSYKAPSHPLPSGIAADQCSQTQEKNPPNLVPRRILVSLNVTVGETKISVFPEASFIIIISATMARLS